MGSRFRTMLAPINAATGDGRRFAPGALTAAPTPFPFEWARVRDVGHDGAVVVGAVQEVHFGTVAQAIEAGWISREGAVGLNRQLEAIWALGEIFDDVGREEMPRLAEDVTEAVKLITEGVLGPSVDLDSFEGVPVREATDQEITWEDLEQADADGEEIKVELLITEGRVRAATLVSIPAFQETSRPLELVWDTEDQEENAQAALTASVIGSIDLPVADQDHTWNAVEARGRVFTAFTTDGKVDTQSVARAFMWRDPEADASKRDSYQLGFADMVDGVLTIIPRGLMMAALRAPELVGDQFGLYARICAAYGRVQQVHESFADCPFEDTSASTRHARTTALIASVTTPVGPATALFDPPQLDGPTPITFDFKTGRVYGHIATWGTCHLGFSDVCITPPKDPGGDYSWFHRYAVETADGDIVWAGRLTVGGRHPDLSLDASSTMAAYDSKTVAAQVRMYEDPYGIAVAGPITPDLSEADQRVLSRRRVSGDWRDTPQGLSLVELLALSPGPRRHSEPGFPVATHSRNGRQVSLTAALGPDADVMDIKAAATAEVRAALKIERQRQLAAAELERVVSIENERIERDRQNAVAKLAEALDIPAELIGGR